MKELTIILEYLKKIFYKKQPKRLQEANNQIKNIESRGKENFRNQGKYINYNYIFYTLVFCIDFMSGKGQTFQDKKIYVDEKIVDKLNCIYDNIINQI